MIMKITGKHVEITPAIRTRIEEKINKLPRYFDSVTQIEVVVEAKEGQQSVELVVTAEHYSPLVAKEVGHDLYTCIDMAVHKMERQVNKVKERQREHKAAPKTEVMPPQTETD